jgi:hypothetical protein
MIWGDCFDGSGSMDGLPRLEFEFAPMLEIVAECTASALPPRTAVATMSDSKKIAERIILAAEKPILAQHTLLETILHTLSGCIAGNAAQKPKIGT